MWRGSTTCDGLCLIAYIGLVGDQAPREEVHILLETFSEDGGMCAVVHI